MNQILIVDDESNILLTLDDIFQKENYEVFITRDVSETIEILKNETLDLILLDIMKSKIDGFETISLIKNNNNFSQTKVIFISAKSKKSDLKKGLELGVDDYITKPFSMKKLVEKVDYLLYNS